MYDSMIWVIQQIPDEIIMKFILLKQYIYFIFRLFYNLIAKRKETAKAISSL